MNSVNKLKWGLCSVAVVLTAMGLSFAWKCPLDCVFGVDSGVFLFKSQLIWSAIGVGACFGASLIPWNRWLKLAPWGLVSWVVLAVAAQFSPPVDGAHKWVKIGCLAININCVFVVAWALFAAWLCSKKHIRPWMIFAFIVGLLLAYVYLHVLGNATRLARICAFFGCGEGNAHFNYMQDQMKAAYATAKWIGDADRSLRYLPRAFSDSMPSASALLFGKWFPLAVAMLFAMFGGFLSRVWLGVKCSSKRMFMLFWGGAMLFFAMYSLGQSVGLLPVHGFTPPLAGCGGALAVTFWLGLGIVFSALSDGNEEIEVPSMKKFAATGAWIVFFAVFAFGVANASAFKMEFRTPPFDQCVLGEFGYQAKRGDIYAADGSALAKSVKCRNVRLDPKTAKEYRTDCNAKAISNICERLELTQEKLQEHFANGKSRYILVGSNVDKPVADWFLSREGRKLAKGFIVEPYQSREYPLGRNAAHVTGYARMDPERGVLFGIGGVEQNCDSVLAGRNGKHARNAGRTERRALATPENGGSATTTIVPPVQNALADALAVAAASSRAEKAWGIAMDARTGAIAAMVSVPNCSPEKMFAAKDGICLLENNAAALQFAPGDLMRPIAEAVSTENGKLAESLPLWGFGRKVCGGTVFGEAKGVLFPAGKLTPDTLELLKKGRITAVTGLQMANAYAAIANGGMAVSPHLIAKTVSTNGIESAFKPDTEPVRVISELVSKETTAKMTAALGAAAKKHSVDFAGVKVAGMIAESPVFQDGKYSKTGRNVLAVGFFPAGKPRWVVSVGFSNPKPEGSDGSIALAALAEIVRKTSKMK